MSNRYLEKIAASAVPGLKRPRDWMDYTSFGLGLTGLGLGASRTAYSRKAGEDSAQKKDLEAKSLRVLNSIDRKLSAKGLSNG